ncbi:unnamed protein product, partial [Mesorhabditis spiculigera]
MDDSFDQLSPRGIPKLAPSTSSDNLSTPKCKRPRMAFGSHVRVLKTQGVTPEPEYTKMSDDQVKGELAKHGLRPMGRKNAVKLLQQIYESTHPTVDPDEAQKAVSSNSAEEESSDGAQDDHSADENLEESFVFDGDLPKDLDGMQRALVTWLREPAQTEILDHFRLQNEPKSAANNSGSALGVLQPPEHAFQTRQIVMSGIYYREIDVAGDAPLKIAQELDTDVGGVIWDSALVAIAYIDKNRSRFAGKRVLELGAGTGACGLALSSIGANVVCTDLRERLPLIEQNWKINEHLLKDGSFECRELDWNSPDTSLSDFDYVFMIDCVYYLSSVPPLLALISTISPATTIICIFEKRDIGEPVQAQAEFMEKICEIFNVSAIPRSELDAEYVCDDIICNFLSKK